MPFGSDEVVIVNGVGAALIVIERGRVADCDNASVTFTVKLDVPLLVGVPEIVPDWFKARFAGSEPLERLQTSVPVPPVACND